MKAIILAAGTGSRFGQYLKGSPKCLLRIGDSTLLEYQIALFTKLGITDIAVVKGYAADRINVPGVRYYFNRHYHETNMVYSLFSAEPEINGNLIISYADILFDRNVLATLLETSSYHISVVVDLLWKEYYQKRFVDPLKEAESLMCDAEGRIMNIGQESPAPENIQGQYIGLIKLSPVGCEIFREMYHSFEDSCSNKHFMRGRSFRNAYMTDFLQALIDKGISVHSVPIENGWLEFDRVEDYKRFIEWQNEGTLGQLIALE